MLSEVSESMELKVRNPADAAMVGRLLSAAAYEGLAIIEGDEVVAHNSQFAELCGTSAERPTLEQCFSARDVEAIRELLGRETVTYRDRVLCENDDGTWLEVRTRADLDELPDGQRILVVRDVTQQAEAEEELRRTQADLEQFAYVASHDLKSPLRGISNLASWIREDIQQALNGPTAEYFELLEGRIRRMETLLDDLLAYSRAGREHASVAPFWLDEFLEDLVEFVSPPDEFEIEIQSEHIRVTTTPTPLRTVVQNLVQNSFKHHDRRRGHLLVATAVDEESNELIIEVEDDGPGIPPRFHDKVFAIFETLRPRDEVEGSGIGLALVRRLVEDAGGVIELQSPVNNDRGACFRLTWPLLESKPVDGEKHAD